MSDPKRLSIFGSTGSIGTSALSFIAHANAQQAEAVFDIDVLTAGRNVALLVEQAKKFRPNHVVIQDHSLHEKLNDALADTDIVVAAGDAAIVDAARRPVDRVLAAIVGIDGLPSTLAAIETGNDVAIANKESIICAGPLLKSIAVKTGARLIPTDSEHNAIFQVMERAEDVDRLILTASGGPFRTTSLSDLQMVTPQQALAHPRWNMGRKISIDSATLFNKGLELIEAAYLFDMPEHRIDVVVHPESIMHSAVAYRDGSVLAQLGNPDMRTPLAHALTWPDRRQPTTVAPLDLIQLGQLHFEAVDARKFPAISLSRDAVREGGGLPGILNCSNEHAVAAFLAGQCRFMDISSIVEAVMTRFKQGTLENQSVDSLEAILEIDAEAKRLVDAVLGDIA